MMTGRYTHRYVIAEEIDAALRMKGRSGVAIYGRDDEEWKSGILGAEMRLLLTPLNRPITTR